jgi:RecA-family ATPase
MNIEVLERIWGNGEDTYVFTPTIYGWVKDKSGKVKAKTYKENKARSPKQALTELKSITDDKLLGSQLDCYFCPVMFKYPHRTKDNSVDYLNVLWADLDSVDPRNVSIKPTIAWCSSKDRYQGIWLLNGKLFKNEIENLNKLLTYAIGADKSGWDLTQLLRVPGSYNFKYGEPQKCTLLWEDGQIYDVEWIKSVLVDASDIAGILDTKKSIDSLITGWKLPKRALELLYATYAPVGERSDRLWELEKLLLEAGMPVKLVVDIVKNTVWNKFADRRDGDKQLLNETLKAEAELKLSKITTEIVELTESTNKFQVLTFDELIEKNTTSPEFLVEGFVQKVSVGVLAGEPKTMKSTMMLDMAVSVASGKPFLGVYRTQQVPVLYIQEENSESDIKHRFMRIAYHRQVIIDTPLGIEPLPIPLYIMNNTGLNLQETVDKEYLEEQIVNNKIGLLILDPWYMMCGDIDENSAKDVSPILKYLTSLRNKYNCTIMLVHHFKKAESSRGGQRMRGSSVFHAWAENGLYVELNRGKPGNIILEREFRAFPSTTGLNIVFKSDNPKNMFDYDVSVYAIDDIYIMKTYKEDGELVEEKEVDPEIEAILSEEVRVSKIEKEKKKDKEDTLTYDKILREIRGKKFNLSSMAKTYNMTRIDVLKMVRALIKNGKLRQINATIETHADVEVV